MFLGQLSILCSMADGVYDDDDRVALLESHTKIIVYSIDISHQCSSYCRAKYQLPHSNHLKLQNETMNDTKHETSTLGNLHAPFFGDVVLRFMIRG